MSASSLGAIVRSELARPVSPALAEVAADLRERHGSCVEAILAYGSCLRRADPHDGLVDLYVLVDSYRSVHRSAVRALPNRLLPPNVSYVETETPGGIVRAKVAVMTLAAFERATGPHTFEPYFWGRFAQPSALVWARDDDVRATVARAIGTAVTTFVRRVLPLLPARFHPAELWERGLVESYRTEWRPESRDMAAALVADAPERYDEVTCAALEHLGVDARREADSIEVDVADSERRRARTAWILRRVEGRLLGLARLVKALFTFDGAIAYAIWKIERHAAPGPRVESTDRAGITDLVKVFWRSLRGGRFR